MEFRRVLFRSCDLVVGDFDARRAGAGIGNWVRDGEFFGGDFVGAATDEAFDGIDGASGVNGAKALGRSADDGVGLFGEVNDRGRQPLAIATGNDIWNAGVNCSNQRVSSSQINSDNATHGDTVDLNATREKYKNREAAP